MRSDDFSLLQRGYWKLEKLRKVKILPEIKSLVRKSSFCTKHVVVAAELQALGNLALIYQQIKISESKLFTC